GVVLVFAAALSSLNVVFEEGLRGLGESDAVFWGEAVGLVITAASLALLLPSLGIMGAGLASIFGYFSTFIALLRRLHRTTGCSVSELLVLKRYDCEVLFRKNRTVWAAIRLNRKLQRVDGYE